MKLNTVTIGKTNTISVIITNAKKKKKSEWEKHPRLEWKVFNPIFIESFQVFICWGNVFFCLKINFHF